jgi:predicted regulator of Ras-like GTPase activity (Roadblock/LC7/MglB family)
MSFRSILGDIVDGCGDCLGAVLMGSDGIPIEEVGSGHTLGGPLAEELGTAGVEFGRILDDIRKASDALAGGALDETVVVLTRFSLVFRPIDAETFLVLVVAPDGNLGKARYLMRRYLLAIRQEL